MLNDGVNNVPENTIALFKKTGLKKDIPINRAMSIISKPSKKRDWFTSHFYNCLPIVIGNQYGFLVKNEVEFEVFWNGNESPDSVVIKFNYTKCSECNIDFKMVGSCLMCEKCGSTEFDEEEKHIPKITSHFGSGIITIETPFILRTPPGINLMTINPPNYILPNMTVMTGVVEADNLRFAFTFNIKIQSPNIKIVIPKNTPLSAFIPVPRGTVEKYNIVDANSIFSKDIIEEEMAVYEKSRLDRLNQPSGRNTSNKQYFKGIDAYGNQFPNFHQGASFE
jgi:hypothetical protein